MGRLSIGLQKGKYILTIGTYSLPNQTPQPRRGSIHIAPHAMRGIEVCCPIKTQKTADLNGLRSAVFFTSLPLTRLP